MFKTVILFSAAMAAALPTHADAKRPPVQEFDSLAMIVERNATDDDTEIVILAKTEEEGLAKFVVRGPHHNVIFSSRSRDYGNVGIREYALETAEPAGGIVLNAYPEGVYEISGRTVSGARVAGSVELNHTLPIAPGFMPNGDVVDPAQPLVVQWDDVGGESYTVEIENDDLGFTFAVTVPAPTTTLTIAANTLEPGTEYEIGILVENEYGNVVAVEGDFSTMTP